MSARRPSVVNGRSYGRNSLSGKKRWNKKADDIATSLEKCRQQFPELRGVNVDNLMYIKVGEFLAMPTLSRCAHRPLAGGPHNTTCMHVALCTCARLIPVCRHYTFYDFIINKVRGKSRPLFNFDVHGDVRLLADATREKNESHAGKVVERNWYQRNKHIFPASRWEVSLVHSF